MEIKTQCTDDAILVLDRFRIVASFRGVVAQGFGPMGYWNENDFEDQESRRLMVGDFFQFKAIYKEQESLLKNVVFDNLFSINEELQGLLYNSVNSVVALRLKANQFRKCVMSDFETEIWVVNKYNKYLGELKKHNLINNDSILEVVSMMNSIGMTYMNSVNVINNTINELFEAIGDNEMCIPSLFVQNKKDDAVIFLSGDEEKITENLQTCGKRGRKPKFGDLKENTLEAFIEYSTGNQGKAETYTQKIVDQLTKCTTGEELAALAVALEHLGIIRCIDNGGVKTFWNMLHEKCETIVGYEAMNDSYKKLEEYNKKGKVPTECAAGMRLITDYIGRFKEA